MTSTENPLADGVIRVLGQDRPEARRSITHEVDERWALAYAAAVGESRPQYTDLRRVDGIACHPVFPVCIEWPLMSQDLPGADMSTQTHRLGLHVSHSIQVAGNLRPGQSVRTEAGIYLAEQKTNATLIGIEFLTYSAAGELLVTSRHDSLYRGVVLDGVSLAGAPRPVPAASPETLTPVADTLVDSTNAIIYTECARIWNPIHTDVRVAKAAGLPDAVLHGTEVLARAVSAISRSRLAPEGARVASLTCRFTGVVVPGMTLTTSGATISSHTIAFEVMTSDGTRAISDGRIEYAQQTAL